MVDRVARGEPVTITRAGQPVAELRPVPKPPLNAETLLARWRRLPYVNYETMREEIDEILDPSFMITEPGQRISLTRFRDHELGGPSSWPGTPTARRRTDALRLERLAGETGLDQQWARWGP